jgi:hypothetical protein
MTSMRMNRDLAPSPTRTIKIVPGGTKGIGTVAVFPFAGEVDRCSVPATLTSTEVSPGATFTCTLLPADAVLGPRSPSP